MSQCDALDTRSTTDISVPVLHNRERELYDLPKEDDKSGIFQYPIS